MDGDPQSGFCLRCRYDLRSCLDLVCSECGRAFDPADLTTFYRPGTQRSWRLRAGPPSLWHLLAVAVFVIGYPLAASLPGGTLATLGFGAPVALLVATGLAFALAFDLVNRDSATYGDLARAARDRRPQHRSSAARWLILPFCLSIAASVWHTAWPVRIRFALSRTALEKFVLDAQSAPVVSASGSLKLPTNRIGWFPIRAAYRYGLDGVYLQTGLSGFDRVGLDFCSTDQGCHYGQRRIAEQWFVDEQ